MTERVGSGDSQEEMKTAWHLNTRGAELWDAARSPPDTEPVPVLGRGHEAGRAPPVMQSGVFLAPAHPVPGKPPPQQECLGGK